MDFPCFLQVRDSSIGHGASPHPREAASWGFKTRGRNKKNHWEYKPGTYAETMKCSQAQERKTHAVPGATCAQLLASSLSVFSTPPSKTSQVTPAYQIREGGHGNDVSLFCNLSAAMPRPCDEQACWLFQRNAASYRPLLGPGQQAAQLVGTSRFAAA